MNRELSEQEIVRRESLKQLRELGLEPYPAEMFHVNSKSQQIIESYKDEEKLEVVIAGRLMSRRIMGKASLSIIENDNSNITDGKIFDILGREWKTDLPTSVTCIPSPWFIYN